MTGNLSRGVRPEPLVLARLEPLLIQTSRGAVEYASTGSGPAVLCLHGAMGGYDQGLLLARTIGAAGYRYIGPSRPGYLRTPLSGGRSPEEQADLYAGLLDALRVERCGVMAVSGGGPSAIHFALRHRDRCWGLVLVSTCAERADARPPVSFAIRKLLMRLPGWRRRPDARCWTTRSRLRGARSRTRICSTGCAATPTPGRCSASSRPAPRTA